MSASKSDRWRLACHGLLRPSPWLVDVGGGAAARDGEREREREAARQARLDGILGRLESAEQELVHACMREAHHAHVPEGLAPASATSMRTRMVHPLSAETTGMMDADAWDQWFEQEDELLGRLEGQIIASGDVSGALYREIWRRVMTARQPAPGSLWLADHDISAHRSLTAALVAARAGGGEPALLGVHLGPVQGFIASARRTHDLWIGSYTVAYLTLRAAVAIAEHSGPQAVVMPALAHLPAAQPLLFPDELEPHRRGGERFEILRKRLRSSLSNKMVAVVSLEQAAEAARQAAEAAHAAWKDMARAMREHLDEAAKDIAAFREDEKGGWQGFDEQLDAHLEIDAVLQPWPGDLDGMRKRLADFDLEVPDALAPEHDAEHSRGAAYGALYDLGHRMLAAHRKALAPAWPEGDRRPKCSQCGQREQMGPVEGRPHERRRALAMLSERLASGQQRESLQLTRGEGLCAVCLTKRFAPERFYAQDAARLGVEEATPEEHRRLLAFPSTYSIASAPFRERLLQALEGERVRDRAAFQQTAERWARAVMRVLDGDCLAFTPPGNLIPGLSQHRAPAPAEALTLDGQWLYDSSYQPDTAWLDHYPERDDESQEYTRLKERLPEAFSAYREMLRLLKAGPSSYFAVLRLDGDAMGKWLTGRHPRMPRLDELVTGAPDVPRPLYPALHGDLSRRLSRLALRLHDLVEDVYLGRVVYSGGDDLLAFLPVQTALRCLRAIERAVRGEEYLGGRVTVSAGLAIAHVRAPLGRALHEAHEAEDAAKHAARKAAGAERERAHLAVHVIERSGAPLRVCLPWRIERDARETSDTIDTLYEMLAPRGSAAPGRDGDGDPLLRVAVAHRLQAELAELAGAAHAGPDDALSMLFRHRVSTLLVGKALSDRVRAGFQALLARLAPREMVDLVLLLRFLAREDRGVDARDLCRHLEREGAP